MATEPELARIIKSNIKRYRTYIALAVIIAGVVLGTLISSGVLSQEVFNDWRENVAFSVVGILGVAGTIMAAFNTPREDGGGDVDPGDLFPNLQDDKDVDEDENEND